MDERIRNILTHRYVQISVNEVLKNEFISIFTAQYGINICGTCPGVLQEAYNKLTSDYNKPKIQIMETNYKFKLDPTVVMVYNNKNYTALNNHPSDLESLAAIKQAPSRAKNYTQLPANWQELVDDFDPKKPKNSEDALEKVTEYVDGKNKPLSLGEGEKGQTTIVGPKPVWQKENKSVVKGNKPKKKKDEEIPPAPGANEPDSPVAAAIKKMGMDDLIAFANTNELPKDEWEGLPEDTMKDYLIAKMK